MKTSWFEKLFGFEENASKNVQAQFDLCGTLLTSRANQRQFECGQLQIMSLQTLRFLSQTIAQKLLSPQRSSIREVVADVQDLHASQENFGAIFQVASQFNLLEMPSPSTTPEAGINNYIYDQTQGPTCAISAAAATIYRNYFVPVEEQLGQTKARQINCLSKLEALLNTTSSRGWNIENGYALLSLQHLEEANTQLQTLDEHKLDALRAALEIGIQWDAEVTIVDSPSLHQVTQVFCSAMPVTYSGHDSKLWQPIAQLVLEATYEATFCAALINKLRRPNAPLYLTLVGGGVFGNELQWITSAIDRAFRLYAHSGLDVRIVSYGQSKPQVDELVRSISR